MKRNWPGRWVTPMGEVAAGGSLCAQRRGVSRDYFPGAELAHTVPRCCYCAEYGVAAGHPLSTAGRDRQDRLQPDLVLRAGRNQHGIRSAVALCCKPPGLETPPLGTCPGLHTSLAEALPAERPQPANLQSAALTPRWGEDGPLECCRSKDPSLALGCASRTQSSGGVWWLKH